MAQPLTVALPPGLELWGDCVIRVTALDAATGDEVAGVTVSDVTLEVDQTGGGDLAYGPFMLVTGPGG
jgi:hypothetical protein